MKSKTITTVILFTVGLGGVALSLPSCSKPPAFSNSEWNGSGNEPLPESLSEEKSQAKFGTQNIEFQVQAVAGVPIQGTYMKTLSRSDNPQWIKARFLEKKNLPTPESVHKELQRTGLAKHLSLIQEKKLGCKYTGDFNPELRWKGSWNLVFKRTCETPAGLAYEVVVNSNGTLLSSVVAGATFTMENQIVNLYPNGPKKSDLKTVDVSVAINPDYLVSDALEVVSDSGTKFSDLNQLQKTSPSDAQFDMLQAYYYSSRSLDWVAQHIKYQLNGLKLRTNVGYPRNVNVAFFFNNEIRIGAGDDITYSHMAWDPTVVIHETMHGVITALTHLPLGSGEGGSLQEGLADTLTALQLNNPNMGDSSYKAAPFQRTLENQMKVSDKTGGLYHDSLIFSGTIWEIREKIDETTAINATVYMLGHLAPSSVLNDVKTQFGAWRESITDPVKARQIADILTERGWD